MARAARRMLKQGYVSGKNKGYGRPDHRAMAEALRKRVFEGPGKTDQAFRQAIAQRAIDGPPIEDPYDGLALQIGEAAYKVTDEQVKGVVAKSGSEKAAFEIITTAGVSTGLYRWNKGHGVLKKPDKRDNFW